MTVDDLRLLHTNPEHIGHSENLASVLADNTSSAQFATHSQRIRTVVCPQSIPFLPELLCGAEEDVDNGPKIASDALQSIDMYRLNERFKVASDPSNRIALRTADVALLRPHAATGCLDDGLRSRIDAVGRHMMRSHKGYPRDTRTFIA